MSLKKRFSFESVGDFDRHISLSIPDYIGLASIFRAICLENINPHGRYIDIGCSTGKFISDLPKIPDAIYEGVDVIDIRGGNSGFDFRQCDAVEYLKSVDSADVITLIFTLQFMGKHKRRELIKELARLNEGGTKILLAEKVYLDNSKLNQTIHREHIKTKREAFSEAEILDKDYELLGSMFCLSEAEINKELGVFMSVCAVWQSYNFKAWCIS